MLANRSLAKFGNIIIKVRATTTTVIKIIFSAVKFAANAARWFWLGKGVESVFPVLVLFLAFLLACRYTLV